MRCLVTGSAGFIGSHLCEELLRRGHTVHGLDCFLPNYSPNIKAQNQGHLLAHPQFHFHGLDLRQAEFEPILQEADVIFHLAALPGLARCWTNFDDYLSCNVMATERLIQLALRSSRLNRFIHASTASVYGAIAAGGESAPLQPVSPYGVSKLTAEHLGRAHLESARLPWVGLRFFTVYGPRQRPDMAYHQFFQALIEDRPILVYGEGQQRRSATFVLDCVRALIAAIEAPTGECYNVGGDQAVSVTEVLHLMQQITKRRPRLQRCEPRTGDQVVTLADTSKIRHHLGWQATTSLSDGLETQWRWHLEQAPRTVRPRLAPASTYLKTSLNSTP